jgi:uncharacterized protein YdeI (YjbR/CyaY-like superfamily)
MEFENPSTRRVIVFVLHHAEIQVIGVQNNINKIEELTKAGLMKPAGLKAFSLRKENKSEVYSYENDALLFDSNYEIQFKENKKAWDFFIKQAPSYKKAVMRWIMSAMQEKTRQSRLEKTIKESEQQKRVT